MGFKSECWAGVLSCKFPSCVFNYGTKDDNPILWIQYYDECKRSSGIITILQEM